MYLRTNNPGNIKKYAIDPRIRIASLFFSACILIIIARLFLLMIIDHSFYSSVASGNQELYKKLYPNRGSIFLQSVNSEMVYPLVINKELYNLYLNTKEILDDESAEKVATKLAEFFSYDDEKKLTIYLKANKRTDPYEPIENKIETDKKEEIEKMELPGVHFVELPSRFYPENNLLAQVIGFLGKDDEGNDVGHYGLEGYWNKELSGKGGFLEGLKSAKGSIIAGAEKSFEPAEDGVDLYLTIDRTLQSETCAILKRRMELYEAQAASLIIMNPKTGAILTMCSFPDFDPNNYGKVDSVAVYNNLNIYEPYEPGSIFKPIAMSAALNEEILSPDSYFHDSGSAEVGCTKPIKNADGKSYGDQTMTGVLENSINTGMVYVVNKLGKEKFVDYIQKFGFGVKTGLELDTENTGTYESLLRNDMTKVDCYTATASFGQGITATPIQMISAFAAIANGGKLMKPYIIAKKEYFDGRIEETKPLVVRDVLTKKTSALLSGMLVRVIDKGQGVLAKVNGYYLAGKTGTAQIAGPNGYTDEYNHSFIGFGPVDDPKFIVMIRLEKPKLIYSSTTAAPTFSEIANYILKYYKIPKNY
ncbi:MAG: penicillin-binding protein 2 [Patescibacteria group bacterium]